jgi:hypothetical protein
MRCLRCGSTMLLLHNREVEHIGDAVLETDVFINECATCSAMVKVILPLIPDQTLPLGN